MIEKVLGRFLLPEKDISLKLVFDNARNYVIVAGFIAMSRWFGTGKATPVPYIFNGPPNGTAEGQVRKTDTKGTAEGQVRKMDTDRTEWEPRGQGTMGSVPTFTHEARQREDPLTRPIITELEQRVRSEKNGHELGLMAQYSSVGGQLRRARHWPADAARKATVELVSVFRT